MNLRQLQYFEAIALQGHNISMAAAALQVSQPGISKQMRLLEEELGVQILRRRGRRITGLSTAGQAILPRVQLLLRELQQIRALAAEHGDKERGRLAIGTTHTQARYVLPTVLREFSQRHPQVSLQLHQGTPRQLAAMINSGEVDLLIVAEALELFHSLVLLPCHSWGRCLLVPAGHPLEGRTPTIEELSKYPLVSYVFARQEFSVLEKSFRRAGLEPQIVLSATDTEIIKTYVRLGMGVGVMAKMAWDAEQDGDLVMLEADHLFERSTSCVAFPRSLFLRRFLYDFLRGLAPHLEPSLVDRALSCGGPGELQSLWAGLRLPAY